MSIDTLWYTRCPVPTAFSVAIRLGWIDDEFDADGIVARSLASSTDPEVRVSHYRHTQPNSFRHGGNIPPLVSRSRGGDLRLIGLSWTEIAYAVLAPAGSGIRNPGDLRGKRLSLPRRVNDSIDFWRGTVLRGYATVLERAGLSFDDVQLIDIPIERSYLDDATANTDAAESLWGARSMFPLQREEAVALIRREADVVFSEGALVPNLKAFLGLETVIDVSAFGQDPRRPNNGLPLALTVSGGLLDDQPEIVTRWLARVLEAADWASEHEDETKRIVAIETGLPEDFVNDGYSSRVHEQLDVDLSPDRLDALRSQHDLLLEHGFLAAAVDLDAFVAHEPLRAARELVEQRAIAGV